MDFWTLNFFEVVDYFSCFFFNFIFQENHTAENIKDYLVNLLELYNIEKKIVSITTDNASNMIKAVELLNRTKKLSILSFTCAAHKMNLIVKKYFPHKFQLMEVILIFLTNSLHYFS